MTSFKIVIVCLALLVAVASARSE
uniref:Isoform 2 of N.vectensis toxin 1 7 n=1 Tax=Nematostella vectensis TaxID=45351 RepID=A7SCE5-2